MPRSVQSALNSPCSRRSVTLAPGSSPESREQGERLRDPPLKIDDLADISYAPLSRQKCHPCPLLEQPHKNHFNLSSKTTKQLKLILSVDLGPLSISPTISEPSGKSCSETGSPAPFISVKIACLKCQRRSSSTGR